MKIGNKVTTSSKPMLALAVSLALVVAFLGYNLFYVFQAAQNDQANLQRASEMRAGSYRLVSLSREATAGTESAYTELQTVVNQMQQTWLALKNDLTGEVDTRKLAEFEAFWSTVRTNAETIIDDKDAIIFFNQVASTLNETLPELQQEHTQVVEILLENRAPSDQVAVAQNQTWLAERIGRNVDKMLAGSEDAEAAADQFNRDANLFGRVLEGMKKGDRALSISRVTDREAKNSLNNITERFEFVNSSIQEIFESTPVLFAARQASNGILDQSPELLEQISGLSETVADLPSNRSLTNQTALIAAVVAVILLAAIGMLIYAGTRASLKVTAETNQQNQEAIMRLLDEIGDLGEGDLTSHATVTEDFTGAIADSINFTIDQLRILVSAIQDTAENVSAAANETRATATQLSDSAVHQADEIAGVSHAVNQMTGSIDQVSKNAAESAEVAEKSVSIAKKGANVVSNTIGGMDTIREQIQDTSKRIKRLGESSQEIGDIVSLINDIADQTNILSLNAAIQASMAGDAGRGFAVVADEVQRLAERSADATKQIASLVKTIQTDTNEAVSSMEQTTAEVVKGAERAQDAGVALEEIEAVSTDLEKLIQDISRAAFTQSETAGQVSGRMQVIQDITSQTLSGTQNTAASTGELADLAVSLRESVSGFKLPASNDDTIAQSEAGALEADAADTPEEPPAEESPEVDDYESSSHLAEFPEEDEAPESDEVVPVLSNPEFDDLEEALLAGVDDELDSEDSAEAADDLSDVEVSLEPEKPADEERKETSDIT